MKSTCTSTLLNFVCLLTLGFQAHADEPLVPISESEAKAVLIQAASDPKIQAVLDQTPEVYLFLNENGVDSVNYIGQTFRQVLINDIKPIAYDLERGGDFAGDPAQAHDAMDSVFRFKRDQRYKNPLAINGGQPHRISPKGPKGRPSDLMEGNFYAGIYPKGTSLVEKLAGNDDRKIGPDFVLGWSTDAVSGQKLDANNDGVKTPEEFVDALMNVVAANAADSQSDFQAENGNLPPQSVTNAAITKDGLDVAQLVQKFLHGAVALDQATGDYMSIDLKPGKGLTADNTELFTTADGVVRPFTVLEHHWDEAFGYFGAARDYSQYTEAQITKGLSVDSYVIDRKAPQDPSGAKAIAYKGTDMGDGKIAAIAEKNFGMSVNAAKRDVGSQGKTQFAKNLNSYFLEARQLITERPEGYLKFVQAYSVLISVEWERVLAATAIHYVNKLQKDYASYGTDAYKFVDLAKHFSEMKGFAMAIRFNPSSPMDTVSYAELHRLLGDTPLVPRGASLGGEADVYIENLSKARSLMAEVYGFTPENDFPETLLKGW